MNIFWISICILCSIPGMSMRRFRVLQDNTTCQGQSTSYAISLIDASANAPGNNCSYNFSFVTGECMFNSLSMSEQSPGQICYRETGPLCQNIDTTLLEGFAMINCDGNLVTESIESVFNYTLQREFQVNTTSIKANILVHVICNVQNFDNVTNVTELIPPLRECGLILQSENNSDIEAVSAHETSGPERMNSFSQALGVTISTVLLFLLILF